MTWESEMEELRRREAFAEELGGPERVKRQHDGGRLTIRERIAKLADPGTFHEIGKIAGSAAYDAQNNLVKLTPSNFVFGRAEVEFKMKYRPEAQYAAASEAADDTLPDGQRAYFLRAGEGPRHELGGQLQTTLIGGDQTSGRVTMTTVELPKGPGLTFGRRR